MGEIVHRILRFDRFELDVTRGCLRSGDRELALRPKTFKVLHHLVENAGRLVSKEELQSAIWGRIIVSEDSLVQCIRQLRRSLADDERRLIKTMSRRGYLLDVQVFDHVSTEQQRLAAVLSPSVQPVDQTPVAQAPLPLPAKPSIVVLPFQSMSGDPDQEYFADGVVEEIITALSRFRSLFVIARNSSFTYKGRGRRKAGRP